VTILGALLTAITAPADARDVLVGPTGLSGGRYVGSALPAPAAVRMGASLGYGYTEAVLEEEHDHHHRLALELAAAWVVAPWLQLALAGEGRVDHHTPDGEGHETGWLGSAHITTRHAFMLGKSTAIALQPRVLFPGASDVSHGLKATSVELAALLSQKLPRDLELALNLGYRIDRTRYAVRDADELVAPERLAAALSEHNAYLLGLLLTAPLGPLQLAGEWSWEITAGGAPSAVQSPMRVRAALQGLVGERWLPGFELGVDTSARPAFEGLVRIEPRLWARISLSVRLDVSGKGRVRVPRYVAPATATPQTVGAPSRHVAFDLTNPQGAPIAGARVQVQGQRYTSDENGRLELDLPEGIDNLTIEAEGYEPWLQHVGPTATGVQRVSLAPPPPVSEIKGVVRNLASEPLVARIEVQPQGVKVTSDHEGQFVIRIAPGDYKLRISADGYESQERPAQVEPSGVTIIVVDMKRAHQ
jgi:hypothetical protein